jgi:hypothetical protein
LGIFHSARIAAEQRYGLEVVEGDLRFYAADGSPLEANFIKEPSFATDMRTFFPGVYTLRPGTGNYLQTVLAERIAFNVSPYAQIMVYVPISQESASNWGWPNAKAMEDGIAEALKILPSELLRRVTFKKL